MGERSMQASIEFWFEFGSTYSYLSVMRIEELAASHGVGVHYRPFLLGPIFRSFGLQGSPFNEQPQKGAYMWRDLERNCELLGIPWRKPSVFPRHTVLAMRIALVGAEQPWMGAYCRETMLANFARDEDIASEAVLASILERIGLNAAEVLAEAVSEPNKTRLREQTEEAQKRGIFGAPMFFARGEMFWGNDRLEQAIEWAKRT
jgi:2-hydroxychromene-2-carboxylate isomerase